jgi:hypothetical protein
MFIDDCYQTHTHARTHASSEAQRSKFSAYCSKSAAVGRDHCKSLTAMSRTLTMRRVKSEQTSGLIPPFTKWTPETVPGRKRKQCYDMGVFPNLLSFCAVRASGSADRLFTLFFCPSFVCGKQTQLYNRYHFAYWGLLRKIIYPYKFSYRADSVDDHFMWSCHSVSVRLSRMRGMRWRNGWGTTLQTGRSWDRFLMVSLEFFIDIILPTAL